MLNLILKGEAHAVYQNTETDNYELWITAGTKLDPKLIDQIDVFADREDALEALDFEETAYEDFFKDPYDVEPDIDEDAVAEFDDDEFDRWFNALFVDRPELFEVPDPDEFRI